MNDRIKELAEQATVDIKDEYGHWIGSELDLEKFAELIVDECCVKLLDMDGKANGIHNYYKHAAIELKRHFKERLVLSSADNASPAVDAIRDFASMRGLSLDDAKVQDWQDMAKDTTHCYKCGTELMNAPGIGPFCPNKECDVVDATSGNKIEIQTCGEKL